MQIIATSKLRSDTVCDTVYASRKHEHFRHIPAMSEELVFEVWLNLEPDGQMLPGLCLAGPMGDSFRASLVTEHAILVDTLTGRSHFNVMTKYWQRQGWGKYRTEHAADYEPFPEQWREVQRAHFGNVRMPRR